MEKKKELFLIVAKMVLLVTSSKERTTQVDENGKCLTSWSNWLISHLVCFCSSFWVFEPHVKCQLVPLTREFTVNGWSMLFCLQDDDVYCSFSITSSVSKAKKAELGLFLENSGLIFPTSGLLLPEKKYEPIAISYIISDYWKFLPESTKLQVVIRFLEADFENRRYEEI